MSRGLDDHGKAHYHYGMTLKRRSNGEPPAGDRQCAGCEGYSIGRHTVGSDLLCDYHFGQYVDDTTHFQQSEVIPFDSPFYYAWN